MRVQPGSRADKVFRVLRQHVGQELRPVYIKRLSGVNNLSSPLAELTDHYQIYETDDARICYCGRT